MECVKNIIFVYLVWFSLSLYVYGLRDFFRQIEKRIYAGMNPVNAYIYEITFISIYLVMVVVDLVYDYIYEK